MCVIRKDCHFTWTRNKLYQKSKPTARVSDLIATLLEERGDCHHLTESAEQVTSCPNVLPAINTCCHQGEEECSAIVLSSGAQSCATLCDPMNCSTPGLPVHHQLREFTQTHVHRVGDAIQPSHPLLFPSPPAPNPSQHQGLFQ